MEEQRTCLVNHRHSVSTQCSMQLFLTISRNILLRMKSYIPHTKIKKKKKCFKTITFMCIILHRHWRKYYHFIVITILCTTKHIINRKRN